LAGIHVMPNAKIACPDKKVHLPFEDGPYRMAMALQAVPEAEWIEIDAAYPEQMALRRELLAQQRDAVLAAQAGSEPYYEELLSLLTQHVTRHFPEWFTLSGNTLHNRLSEETWNIAAQTEHPLAIAGQLVQEDFCLLRLTPDGPRLTAAVLCFPSHWLLSEKLGRTLAPIHDPVPFYGERLARPVDRFFAALKPGRVAVRLNWTVTANPALFQPSGHNRNDKPPMPISDDAGDKLFLRVERQTFRRLPQTGAVAFGIRVHVTKLAKAITRPADAHRLANAVSALPPEMSRYKSMLPIRDALFSFLRAVTDREVGDERP